VNDPSPFGAKTSAASSSPSLTFLIAAAASGEVLTVRPFVCSSAVTIAFGAAAVTGWATTMSPAVTDRPKSSPSSVIRIIGKTSDQKSVMRRRNVIRSWAMVVAPKRPGLNLIRGTPAR